MSKTLELYNECMEGEKGINSVEKLRFFCSLAMHGDDWLDVEPFFDGVQAEIGELVKMLTLMHESFSEDMYIKPRRELEELLAKHKQEKE